jgi:hypothetical protein
VAVGRDCKVGRDDFSIRVAVSKSGCGRGRVGYQAESCPIRKEGEKCCHLFAGCACYDQEVAGILDDCLSVSAAVKLVRWR